MPADAGVLHNPLAVSLTSGARLGPYEIVCPVGAGGMGEVYKARDTRLDRTVAVKILSRELAADPEFRDRFEREARTISQLTHPHICRLYDVGRQDDTEFLVMEFLEGESLADRFARSKDRPLPVKEALTIAIQVADALAAAHRAGIVHRDLKPGNILVTSDGAKLLDFGLAKHSMFPSTATGPLRATSPSLTAPPTVTSPLTIIGSIVGTLQYMSPEQLDGKDADARSDVFAFGAVLYEMLSGRRAFQGKTQVSVMAAIIEQDPPPLTSIDPSYSAALDRVVRKCLAKDPAKRWQTVADLADEIQWIAEDGRARASSSESDTTGRPHRHRVLLAAPLAVAALGLVISGWAIARVRQHSAAQAVRFTIVPSASQPLSFGQDRNLAISPDGKHIVYGIGVPGTSQLIVRDVDHLETRAVAYAGARQPFFSRDSEWIGFFTSGNELKKVPIMGGSPITLARITGSGRGATWGPDGRIIFATTDTTGLLSVPSGGGEPKELTKPDAGHGESDHYFPSFLPNGRAVLFTVYGSGRVENQQIAAFNVTTGQQKIVIRGGSQPEYVEDDAGAGYLVYAAAGTLRAVRFDADRLETRGEPVPVAEQVQSASNAAASYAVARNGTLVYVPGGLVSVLSGMTGVPRSLVWVNRQGHEDPLKLPERSYSVARLSPDGKRLALEIDDQDNDIWTADLARGTLSRLTVDPASDTRPVWTPDGSRIIFTSTRSGAPNLFWRRSDGTGADERLTTSNNLQIPSFVANDGKRLLVTEVVPGNAGDIMSLALDAPAAGAASASRGTELLIGGPFIENNPELSPDGRWLAYSSTASGETEIYVRPFPNINDGLWQVSNGGGSRPTWARSGRELFFLDGSNVLTSVPVEARGSTFRAGVAVRVLRSTYFTASPQRTYDVTADGQKFLMIKETAGDRSALLPRLVVVTNWTEELKARVPVQR